MIEDLAGWSKKAFDGHSMFWLLCRFGTRLGALPLGSIVETMRPLPTAPVIGAQCFVQGLSIVRGVPAPVVGAAWLFDGRGSEARRWVTIQAGGRSVVLAVDEVLGISASDVLQSRQLPPLLKDAVGELVDAVGMLDAELLLFLNAARLVPKAIQAVAVPEREA